MKLRIAMLGTRGVPATFGGVEHHVEAIGRRLVERGHAVTVFSQSRYMGAQHLEEYLGMKVVRVPTVPFKHFEAVAHSAMSTVAAMHGDFDLLHYHAVGPGVMTPLPRYLTKAAVIQTIHGLDAERAKWSRFAQSVLGFATWLSARVPDRTIAVSQAIAGFYADRYGSKCAYIPNGVDGRTKRRADVIRERFGLRGKDYILFVGRLVPEKNPHLLVRAFRQLDTDLRLVVAGGSSYTDDYVNDLVELTRDDHRITLTGYVYGDLLDELFTNAALFVLPSSLEGLPLTLLEAIESGIPILASDIAPHLEVLGDEGMPTTFRTNDEASLVAALTEFLRDPTATQDRIAQLRGRVLSIYNWEQCVDELESIYQSAVGR